MRQEQVLNMLEMVENKGFLWEQQLSKLTAGTPLRELLMNFMGVFFHGCMDCYERSTINPLTGLTMQELYENTMKKKHKLIAAGYNYSEMWECKFKKKLKEDEEAREY